MPRDSNLPSSGEVSPLTVNRLSIYLRSLRRLQEEGETRVSSDRLARRFNLSSAQIRKDLAHFGEFGVRGVGYDIQELADRLSALLALDRVHRIGIVGMGNIGTALARSPAFNSGSFLVVTGFDNDPAKVGRRIGGVLVRATSDLARGVAEASVGIGVIAVPGDAAAWAFSELAAAGVRAVLNFSTAAISSLPHCRVKNVDLRVHLEELAFFLQKTPQRRGV